MKTTSIFSKKKETVETHEKTAIQSDVSLRFKKALVIDFGLFPELAASLKNNKNGFGTVWYFVPWQDDFPSPAKQDIGRDFKGIERIQDFWNYVDQADVIVAFDTYFGDLVSYLRKQGYNVWGGGEAEEMELNRWKMRTMQHDAGLPTQQTLQLKSLDDLELYFRGINNEVKEKLGKRDPEFAEKIWERINKKYDKFSEKHYFGDLDRLKKECMEGAQDKFVKGNLRGLFESAKISKYETSLTFFNSIWEKMGHRANAKDVEFIVEEKIEGVEPGTDFIQVNGDTLSPTLWGIERKGAGYIGRILPYGELPKFITDFSNTVSGIMKKYTPTASFFSTEFLIDKNKDCYLIDPTVRNPAPVGSAIYSELYLNLPEIIWYGAQGIAITPELLPAKYAAGVCFDSDWADKHELEVVYDKKIERFLKFRKAYCVNGNTYALSGFSSVCSVIGFGNTPEAAVAAVKERAKFVHGQSLNTSTEGLDQILEKDIPELEKLIGPF